MVGKCIKEKSRIRERQSNCSNMSVSCRNERKIIDGHDRSRFSLQFVLVHIFSIYISILRYSILYRINFVTFVTFVQFCTDELRFKEEPNDVSVSFGGSAFFTCKVEGNENVKVIWTRDK